MFYKRTNAYITDEKKGGRKRGSLVVLSLSNQQKCGLNRFPKKLLSLGKILQLQASLNKHTDDIVVFDIVNVQGRAG